MARTPRRSSAWDILDLYKRNDPWLVAMLEEKMYRHLAQEGLI